MSGSAFSHVSVTPPIAAFHLTEKYKVDKFPKKVNLTIGGKDLPKTVSIMSYIRQLCSVSHNFPTGYNVYPTCTTLYQACKVSLVC